MLIDLIRNSLMRIKSWVSGGHASQRRRSKIIRAWNQALMDQNVSLDYFLAAAFELSTIVAFACRSVSIFSN